MQNNSFWKGIFFCYAYFFNIFVPRLSLKPKGKQMRMCLNSDHKHAGLRQPLSVLVRPTNNARF